MSNRELLALAILSGQVSSCQIIEHVRAGEYKAKQK